MSANNVVKEYAATGNGAYELTVEYKFQYNSSNYPWKVTPLTTFPALSEVEYFYNP